MGFKVPAEIAKASIAVGCTKCSTTPIKLTKTTNDESFKRLDGLDIVSQICRERSDLKYLGLHQAGCFKGTSDYERRKMLKPQIGGIIHSRAEKGVWKPKICRFRERKCEIINGDPTERSSNVHTWDSYQDRGLDSRFYGDQVPWYGEARILLSFGKA
jgi:hypothetical protein